MQLNETIDRLADFAQARLHADELRLWLEQESWDAAPGYTRHLADEMLRVFAEADNGDWTRAELRKYAERLSAPMNFGPATFVGNHVADLQSTDEIMGAIFIPDLGETSVQTVGSVAPDPKSQRSGIGNPQKTPAAIQ